MVFYMSIEDRFQNPHPTEGSQGAASSPRKKKETDTPEQKPLEAAVSEAAQKDFQLLAEGEGWQVTLDPGGTGPPIPIEGRRAAGNKLDQLDHARKLKVAKDREALIATFKVNLTTFEQFLAQEKPLLEKELLEKEEQLRAKEKPLREKKLPLEEKELIEKESLHRERALLARKMATLRLQMPPWQGIDFAASFRNPNVEPYVKSINGNFTEITEKGGFTPNDIINMLQSLAGFLSTISKPSKPTSP